MAGGGGEQRANTVCVLGGERAQVSLVSACLALAGARPASGLHTPEDAVAALARGDLDHLVLMEPTVPTPVRGALRDMPGLGARVTLLPPPSASPTTRPAKARGLEASATMDDVLRAVLGGPDPVQGAGEVFEADAADAPVLPLLGAALRLAPTVKLWFERDEEAFGLCLVDGRVRALGHTGAPLWAQQALREDKSLELVLSLWSDQEPASRAPRPALHGALELVCEYGDLFASSETFRAHEVDVMAALLGFEPEVVRFEAHAPAARGLDLGSLMREGLERQAIAGLRAAAGGDARLIAPAGLPEALRQALPPRRFGRLFFVLEEGATVAEARAAAPRLSEREVLAALALARAAGAVVEEARPRARRGAAEANAPAAVLGASPPPLPTEAGKAPTPAGKVPTPALGTPRPPLAEPASHPAPVPEVRRRRGDRRYVKTLQGLGDSNLDEALCGDPRHFVATLRQAQAMARRTGKRIRLRGTRFEPIGEVRADLALFYRIGGGGMGDVFLGVRGSHASFQKVVAVKRMTEALVGDARRLDMFLTEARLSATLQHPNIVQIFQLLRFGADYLLVMEFVHGVAVAELLRHLAKADKRMPPELVRHVGAEAARALHYAHGMVDDQGQPLGLIHRDVAPDNILIGFDGSVKLIDFGIARAKSDRFSVVDAGARSGRLRYMAPEMLAGQAEGPRSDQFSLAVTLYRMLTGHDAFAGGDADAVVAAIVHGDHPPLLERRPDVPPRLAYAIERAMLPQPSDRFEGCDAFRAALLAGAPGSFDATSQLTLCLDEVLGTQRRHELEAIARMRRAAAALLRTDSRPVARPRLDGAEEGGQA